MSQPKGDLVLTPVEAEGILEDLKYSRVDLRDATKRTDRERLAIGLVMLKMHTQDAKSQRAISEEMQIPQATVSRYIGRALKSIAFPTVTEARQHMVEILDRQIAAWAPRAETDDKAAAVLNRFLEQRAKVTGAFAPIEINQTVTEISLAEREMQAMIAEQEAENKISEDGLEVEV